MSNNKYNDDEFINLIGKRGIMSLRQIAEWMGLNTTRGVDRYLSRMADKENPLIVGRNIPRPWAGRGAQTAYILTSFGAEYYNKLNGTDITAPDAGSLAASFSHSLGVIDIGFALKKIGAPSFFESRVVIDHQTNEFIRPDVSYQLNSDDSLRIIEFEQSRDYKNLNNLLLKRLFRWQKAIIEGVIHSDIIVLFSLVKNDKWMISAWMKALNAFVQKNGEEPFFTIWYMGMKDFLANPTLDTRSFKCLPHSIDPESFLLSAERERFFAQRESEMFSPESMDKALLDTQTFWRLSWTRLLALQKREAARRSLLDACDLLYEKSRTDDLGDTGAGSIPWLSIGLIRFWLERPPYKELRVGLIDVLKEYKSAYGRGAGVAADYLEKAIWESLLYKFNIGRDGPLSFRTKLPDDTVKKKNHPGILPVFEIIAPWAGRDAQEDADWSARSLEWLVNMLIQYPVELGLTKENRKPQSSVALESPSS